MILLSQRNRPRGQHFMLAVAMALLPLLVALPVSYWQEKNQLETRATKQIQQAGELLDKMLDFVNQATTVAAPLAGLPCDQVEQVLREQVATVPYVRSINLAQNGAVYCSSIYGTDYRSLSTTDSAGAPLRLTEGKDTTSLNHPLLSYRQQGKKGLVFAIVDGRQLQLALKLADTYSPVILKVGDKWLGQDQGLHRGPTPQYEIVTRQFSSSNHAYTLITGFNYKDLFDLLWLHYKVLLLAMLVAGLLLGSAVYWLLGRPDSPAIELQRGLDNNEFQPFLQPLVLTEDHHWRGAEVLMRWMHPKMGLIPPDRFLQPAEDSGLIIAITRRMMQLTADGLCKITLPHSFNIAFNISAGHLRDSRLLQDCRDFIKRFPVGSIVLTLELTERGLIEPGPAIHHLFSQLRSLGIKLAIDDFGTGHSSMVYLQQFSVDILKIDRGFVNDIGKDALSGHIVDTMVELANKLRLVSVAEGVETEAQRAYLLKLGVGWLQGYLHGKPMPLAEFVQSAELHKACLSQCIPI